MRPSLGTGVLVVAGLGLLLSGLAPAGTQQQPKQKLDYNRDVRPIITKCFSCHGQNTGDGLAGLRLDNFAGATKSLASGRSAIVPGKPQESELIERINAKDGSIMPPKASNKVLSAEEKQVLAQWIAEGAEYKQHWAFVAPVRPPLPKVKDKNWPVNGIDWFVLAKLEEHGLQPEPEADKRTLIRRATLDITGLPPTPQEVEAFLNDKSAKAYESVVDRLLASPRYGERMAMDWMDYARYADSNGYQADYERYQWRWRDWVIAAFNKNMPYDEFTVEQIAGDLLPNATMDQKLATGFNRNHRINTEGGVIAEEWRVENVIDRLETTSAVWLGLTTGCARCHDHKYDPLTQKDFYRMFSYFNNVPESGTGEERPVNHPPIMDAPTAAQTAQLAGLNADLAILDAEMAKRLDANEKHASQWKIDAQLPEVKSGLVARFAFAGAENKTYTATGPVAYGAGRASGAVATKDDAFLDLGNVGDFEKDQPFSFGAWIKPANGQGSPISRMDSASAYRGWECSLINGLPQAHLINMWPQNALKVAAKSTIPNGKWTHFFMTYDGSMKAAGFKMYLDGKLVETNVENDKLTDTIRTQVTAKVGRRTNSEMYTGEVDDLAIYDRELKPEEVAKLASTHPARSLLAVVPEKRTKEQSREIARYWSLENDKLFVQFDSARNKAQKEKDSLVASIPNVMVMQEMPKPRECHILVRGQYDKPGEVVEAGMPEFLPPLPKGAPNNRLGFAEWIVSPSNPLTARVTVNRLWERFFGAGIVSTVEDFGTRADFPSHPELLDWLATEFVRLKWDMKAMIKEIVMSASYRQSSDLTAENLKADPENRLVSRGPRFRLTGEVIRDQALFVSGLLVERLGGPSVYPYMPQGIWDETNFYGNLRNYMAADGDGLYRRSLYTIWKRTAAPPNMLLFDVPARETCRVHRARTDTPLQALTLMNDETYLEAARVLAQRMMKEGGATAEQRLRFGFNLVLSREPTADELMIMQSSLARLTGKYRKDPDAALDLILVGKSKVALGLDRAELAAYTVTASTLLNLDEAITKE